MDSKKVEVIDVDAEHAKISVRAPPSIIQARPHDRPLAGEDWRNDKVDLSYRKAVLFRIVKMMRDRKQNPTKEWLKELPKKARKLEDKLYTQAPSLEAYLDKSTLTRRVKKVARAMTTNYRRLQKSTSPSKPIASTPRTSNVSSKTSSC